MNRNDKVNNLFHEKSSYLNEYKYSLVNWYPWSKEAFIKAEEENKLILLSIGYRGCHWCSVMKNESFNDENIANLINRDYISIKVDKEENSQVAMEYMKVCKNLFGYEGWPVTILMTPDKIPFFAATYIPRRSKYKMLGFNDLLSVVCDEWEKGKDRIQERVMFRIDKMMDYKHKKDEKEFLIDVSDEKEKEDELKFQEGYTESLLNVKSAREHK